MTLTTKHIVPVDHKRRDSFWYNKQVATVSNGKRTLSIEATGAVAVQFDVNKPIYYNDDARLVALDRGYTDRKLNNLSKHDGWHNNNWFALYDMGKDEYLTDTFTDYYDAIKAAEDILRDEQEDAPLKLKVANCRGKKPLMNDLYNIKTKLDELLIEINSCLGKDALNEASVLLFKVLRDNSE